MRLLRRITTIGTLAVGIGVSVPPASAFANDQAVLFTGGQTDYAGFGFFGATLALPGASLGRGFAVRGSAFAGGYDYDDGTGGLTKANFSGAEFDGIYQISNRNFWANIAVGARDVDTRLAPFDATNRRGGVIDEFATSIDGGKVGGPWRADWYGSYGTRLGDYAARVSLTHAFGPGARFGAEIAVEGDPTYGLHRFGPFLGLTLDRRSEVQFSAGVSQESGRNADGYLRASVYRRL